MTRPVIKKNDQRGFTMIELVFVIVILGILAAFAVPKFVNLSKDARVASLQGLQGSLQSAAALVHAQFLAENLSSSGTVSMPDGTSVALNGGYPDGTAGGIGNAVQGLNGYVSSYSGTTATFKVKGKSSGCDVTYDPTTNPMTTLTSTNC